MCAIEAGKRGRRVAVLERTERIGKKILISGGGRCNFTNFSSWRGERQHLFTLRSEESPEETKFEAAAIVVATGGLSIPKMGATSFGYALAKQFGLQISGTRPALVPLLLNAQDRQHYC